MGMAIIHYEGFRKNGKTLCGVVILDEAPKHHGRHTSSKRVTKDRELVTCRQCLRNHGMGVVREDEA